MEGVDPKKGVRFLDREEFSKHRINFSKEDFLNDISELINEDKGSEIIDPTKLRLKKKVDKFNFTKELDSFNI